MRHTIDRSKVVLEHFDDETILINMDTCIYYSLNGSGPEVWRLIEAGQETPAICAALAAQYDADPASIAAGVGDLLDRLVSEGLVEPASDAAAPSEPLPAPGIAGVRRPFTAPALARYSDMQDLLLLDPIHDVDETGWPDTRPEPNPPAQADRPVNGSK